MAQKVGFFLGNREHTIVLCGTDKSVKSFIITPHGVENFFESLAKAPTEVFVKHKNTFKDSIASAHLSESEVNIVLPDSLCALQIISLPALTEKEILSAIELQADEFIPYPIEKAQYDYQVLTIDKKNNSMSVLLLVSMKELIKSLEEYVLELGLYPLTLETVSTSLYKILFDKNYLLGEDLVLLMNIEDTVTQISLLSIKQQVILMTYSFNLGSGFFVRGIQNYRNSTIEEAQKAFEQFKQDDKDLLSISSSLLNEYRKEIDKVLMSSQEKIGMKPKLILTHGACATTIKYLFEQLEVTEKYPRIEALTTQSLIDKKYITLANKISADAPTIELSAIATCLE